MGEYTLVPAGGAPPGFNCAASGPIAVGEVGLITLSSGLQAWWVCPVVAGNTYRIEVITNTGFETVDLWAGTSCFDQRYLGSAVGLSCLTLSPVGAENKVYVQAFTFSAFNQTFRFRIMAGGC